MSTYFALFLAAIPTSIVGILVWLLEKKITTMEEKQEELENDREKMMVLIIESVNASIALGEAVAIGCKRSGELSGFNGEVEAAMSYATKVKRKQKEFLQEKAVEHMY